MQLSEVIEQYMIDCENRGVAEGTVRLYRRDLGLLAQWLRRVGVVALEGVTLALLRQFLNFLLTSGPDDRFPGATIRGRLAASTVGTYVSVVKVFFQWCFDEELLDANPAARLSRPKTPQKVTPAFTPEHIDKMLAACDTETRSGLRDYVILLVLLDTGMRVSELCNLRLSDVYPRYVKVLGKGQKEREIGLHPEVSKVLWKYIQKQRASFGIEDDHVFLGERGPLSPAGVEMSIRLIGRRAGITGMRVSPHIMRHTFSKEYLKQGGDIFKLSRELGHSGVQITQKYYLTDFNSSDARQVHDAYSPISRMKLRKTKEGKKSRRKE